MSSYRQLPVVVILVAAVCGSAVASTPVQEWAASYTGSSIDSPSEMAVAPNGDIFVVGTFYNDINLGGSTLTSAGGADIFLARYNADGDHIWSKRLGGIGSDSAAGIAVDSGSHVLITGYFSDSVNFGGGLIASAGGDDIFLAEYYATGTHVWSSGFGDSDDQRATDIAVDSSNNIALVGYFKGKIDFGGGSLSSGGGRDACIAYFDGSGSHLWSQGFGDADEQLIQTVAIDNQDYIVFAGYMDGSADFGGGTVTSLGSWDAFLVRLKSNGSHQWDKLVGTTSSELAGDLTFDSDRNIYWNGIFYDTINLGGGTLTSAGNYDLFLVKYDENGVHRWSTHFGDDAYQSSGPLTMLDDRTLCLAFGSEGDVDLGGGVLEHGGGWDVVIGALDDDGDHLWSGIYGSAADQSPRSSAASADGTLVVTGYYRGTIDFGGGALPAADDSDVFIVEMDAEPVAPVSNIVDVANDQGRSVRITFGPSRWDAPGAPQTITGYEIYRRVDPLPGAKLSGWDLAATYPAHGETEYSVIAPTLTDSTITDGMHWSVFLVRAVTADPFTFFDSPPDSGYSLDNLAPGVPAGLAMPTANELVWEEVSDADFAFFTVYASDTPGFESPVVAGRTAATELDVTGTGGDYLAVTATDFAGNESALSAFTRNLSGVPGSGAITRFALHAPVPNPFNPATTIRYDLPRGGRVSLRIFDARGRHVVTLVGAEREAGSHTIRWDGCDAGGRRVASGGYVCRIEAEGFVATRKLTMLK